MKYLRWLNFAIILAFLTACGQGVLPSFPTATSLPPPPVTIVSAPDPNLTVASFLNAWKADDYNTMYGLVSKVTQDTISLEDFAKRNRDALDEMSASSIDYQIMSTLVNPYSAEVSYHIIYKTSLVGDIARDMVGKLVLENGQWKLNWDDSLILPELAGGNILKMQYSV